MPLQRSVHQLRTPTATNGGFDHRQRQCRHPQIISFDHLGRIEIATTQPGTGLETQPAVPRHSHFDDLGSELREALPPGPGQTARDGSVTVSPHPRPNPRPVGEFAVVREEHTTSALSPRAGAHPVVHIVPPETDVVCLGQGDDAVMVAQ
ncbi:hypothetical protein MYFR107205_23175 [Mycolicibacterium frederiksbergense]